MHTFELFRGDTLLGTVNLTEDDFPWYVGEFTPAPGSDDVLSLFALEARLLDRGGAGDQWRAVRDELDAPGIRLCNVADGKEIRRPLIHLRGTTVTWR